MPAQPGTMSLWSALKLHIDNKFTMKVFTFIFGPAQPGLRAGIIRSKNVAAMRSRSRLWSPAQDGRSTSGRNHPSMPAKPGARNKPKHHRHSNGQAATHGYLASDTHSTRRLLARNHHLAHDTCQRHPSSAAPI
eukprot:1779368-Amphidinium_carterae.1